MKHRTPRQVAPKNREMQKIFSDGKKEKGSA
jgi:hypothetical protein